MKIYLDTSVFNRPFDDQSQGRIWLEAQAVVLVLKMIETQQIELVVSSVNQFENSKNPIETRKKAVTKWMALASTCELVNENVKQRADNLVKIGLKSLDALHVAAAEQAKADWFLTCDDRLIKRYKGEIRVANPINFVQEVLGGEV